MYNQTYSVRDLTQMALIAALYVILTITPPLNAISFGAIQFRVSEMLNFMGFYDRKHVLSVTLGCIIANLISSTWVDVIVGAGSTFIFVGLGVKLFAKYQKDLIFNAYLNKGFLYFALFFSFSMVTIALELVFLNKLPFWWTWLTVGLGEMASLLFGGLVMQYLSKRIDFVKFKIR